MLTLLLFACAGAPSKDLPPVLDEPDTAESPADTDSGAGDSGLDSEIDLVALAAQVSEERLGEDIAALAAFGTRHLAADNHDAVRAWLVDRLEAEGLVASVQPFDAVGLAAGNVIAEIPGRDPEAVWIFQAHFDATSELAPELAPGADDNASGVAAVLEAARLLAPLDLEHSVWLVLTDAEEQGSLGSAALVQSLAGSGVTVRGVIAPDMIGYWPAEDGDAFDILGDEDSAALVADMAAVADRLGVANKTWVNHSYCYGDDHTNYQESGIPAIAPMDCVEAHNIRDSGEGYGHYHQSSDRADTLYLPFTAKVTGVIIATLAMWAGG